MEVKFRMSSFTDLTVDALVSKPISAIMQPLRRSCVPVFMMHRFDDPSRNVQGHSPILIRQILSYLNDRGYQGISIKELVLSFQTGKPVPPNAVAFTMDDGFREQADIALPLFEEFRMPVTFFVATDLLDHQHWSWDNKLDYVLNSTSHDHLNTTLDQNAFTADLSNPASTRKARRRIRNELKALPIEKTLNYLERLAVALGVEIPKLPPAQYEPINWEDARQFESEFVQFGPHSCSHAVLSQLSEELARNEIEQSWKRLQEELSNPCPVFCYPSGLSGIHFSEREKKLVSATGMIGALAADPGYARSREKDNLFAIRRFSLPDNLCQFKQYCSWIERAKELTIHRLSHQDL